ncbi:isoprenoid synthase domain-containing protein [Abortiporus biennis]|nr:isoprenoid synthase domain-containing protein [Abortiporus biennis]
MTYEMRKHFSTYSANAIATSFLDYANAELLLRESKDMQLKPSSSTYIEYIRLREGFSEAWAAFIWPESMCPDPKEYVQAFPDAMNFIDLINDIFSYYKEAKAGETMTYVNSYATVHGQNIPQAMRSLVEQTVMVVNRIRDLLGEGRARDAWENFAAGYTQFHLLTPRYRLAEVLPEFF